MKNKLLCLVVLLFPLGAFSLEFPDPDGAKSVAQHYLDAVTNLDYAAYVATLLPYVRTIDEIGSEQALQFWHDELEDAIALGFDGSFDVIPVEPNDDYAAPKAIAVLKNNEGNAIYENSGVYLRYVDGKWWAVMLQ